MPRAKIKTDIVALRIPPQRKEVLKAKAGETQMTLTEYLCLCGLGKKIVWVDGLDEIISELKVINKYIIPKTR